MRNVTGQKFFGFMGKNIGTSLPRIGFASREDPRRGVAARSRGLFGLRPGPPTVAMEVGGVKG